MKYDKIITKCDIKWTKSFSFDCQFTFSAVNPTFKILYTL